MTKNKKLILLTIFGLVVFIIGARLFSPEDEWVCEKGVWVAHGKPNMPQPAVSCQTKTNSGNKIVSDTYCQQDSDCVCGVHKYKGVCFVGNSGFVSSDQPCPDFCSGIDGRQDISCVKNKCQQIRQR